MRVAKVRAGHGHKPVAVLLKPPHLRVKVFHFDFFNIGKHDEPFWG
jgi:hypothetical protein